MRGFPGPEFVITFVNTRSRDADHLGSPTAARVWWAQTVVTQPAPRFTQARLLRLRTLRGRLATVLDGPTAQATAESRSLLDEVAVRPRLDHGGSLTWAMDVPTWADDPIARRVLSSLVDLMDHPGVAAVRLCAADDCTQRFADPSGRRVWCDAARCGNRERVRRHYRRQHGIDR